MPNAKRPRRKTPVDHDPQALRLARIRAGYQQRTLAQELGISPGTLCEAERGTRGINPSVRAKLAKVLNCDAITFEPHAGVRP